jgi:ATP-dependent Clp protease ATP-binding subunit ClpA/DNA-binding CsgD family transcriptional regulator
LTAHEERVLRLLVEGRTTKEIAASLGVSADVVRGDVQSILVKLGVHSRLEAASRSYPELVWERFTDPARRVVVHAQEEARMLNHNYLGTEHILLGLINEGEGVAARALEAMSISFDSARQRVEEIIGQGQAAPTGHIPFTPRAKKVLELSLREALQLGHNYVGTEHVLLGLVREGEGIGAQVLQELGASLQQVRTTVLQLLAGYTASAQEPAGGDTFRTTTEFSSEAPPEGRLTQDPRCPRCSTKLAETLTVKELEVEVGDEQKKVRIAYCGLCGSALGLFA